MYYWQKKLITAKDFSKEILMQKLIIYTMDYCPYCDRAKALLDSKKIIYEEIKVKRSDLEIWDQLQKKSGMRTMPQIFAGHFVIGGFSELDKLNSEVNLADFINSKLKSSPSGAAE